MSVVVEDVAPEASDAKRAVTELTWVTIELLGEDEQPIPGMRYRIELPDGAIAEGRLDGEGLARVRGIEQPGSCSITLPDLDQDATTLIRTREEP